MLRTHSRVLAAALVGTAVEFYDFYIYATAAALVFGPLFFAYAYLFVRPSWPGAIWIIAAAFYVLALPLMLRVNRAAPAPAQ